MIRALVLLTCLLIFSCDDGNPLNPFQKIDLHISNGTIYNGFRDEPFKGHIYIVSDSIIYSGPKQWSHNNIIKTINADGKFVTPGFIDLHAHGDPLSTPSFRNFLAMGVTTIILGQDGYSPPVNPLKSWMEKIDSSGIGVNLGMMVGHGTLRRLSSINNNPEPSETEIDKMKSLLGEHLEYCFGLSSGLEYTPGLYAPQEELIELAKVVGDHDRIIMSHMRNEDDDQLEASIDELIAQGNHCKVHIAHLKSVYGKGLNVPKRF